MLKRQEFREQIYRGLVARRRATGTLAWIGMLVIIASGLLAKLASERPDNNLPDLPAEKD